MGRRDGRHFFNSLRLETATTPVSMGPGTVEAEGAAAIEVEGAVGGLAD